MNIDSTQAPPRFGWSGCAGVSVLAVIFGLALLTDGCVSQDEVARTVSPDGKIVARVVEGNGGALTDFWYTVHLSRNWFLPVWDYQVADLYGAHRSKCAYGVNIRWRNNHTLMIEYRDARAANFERAANVLGRTVNVAPRSGVEDLAAPCGGVAYNQGQR